MSSLLDVDYCQFKDCLNGGVCKEDFSGNYNCYCTQEWNGKYCEILDICIVNKPCLNGGQCRNVDADNYRCICNPDSDWTGRHCDDKIDNCQFHLCKNGACVDGINDYNCSCNANWKGQFCDEISMSFNNLLLSTNQTASLLFFTLKS